MGSELHFIVMGAGFETGNLGVSALVLGTLSALYSTHASLKITLVDYGYEARSYRLEIGNRPVVLDLAPIRFTWKCWLPQCIARLLLVAFLKRILPARIASFIMSHNPWLRLIHSADAVLALNGGDSFSDIYGLRRLVYVSLPMFLPLVLGRPLILLPQTYGPFNGWLARGIARSILNQAQRVFSRDEQGKKTVGHIVGRDAEVEFSPDMAFCLEPRISEEGRRQFLELKKQKSPCVGLNVSGLLYMGGYDRRNSLGIGLDYVELIHQLIHLFIADKQGQVILIPHVCDRSAESDITASKQILSDLSQSLKKSVWLLDTSADAQIMKWHIGQCDFFIGSRMHACIAALSQEIVAVGLAYSSKFQGVFSSAGVPGLALDLRQMSLATVKEQVEQRFNDRQTYAAILKSQLPAMRARVYGMARTLGEIVKENN